MARKLNLNEVYQRPISSLQGKMVRKTEDEGKVYIYTRHYGEYVWHLDSKHASKEDAAEVLEAILFG
ncbi:hypothetical protein KYLE_111 [Pantoea phage Kyle]|uniref:Uncharacterized protein n=1 Tax=Pantoea phage Kyle TaxID=2589665 RepID=A0A514A8M4_9CAUD|nr:hypothetical protein HWC52_gp005 [Pantoea phage Kyle]YP_009849943.1 hypothetical protein HWC52_gp111 [Pantoea phage Kyle]QDH49575.1 hypothetical protein KYLE_5 [Pantoea phage Kyle]QDH49599.1 hypothetical protein KYLE_111 [Pantoea phage Kyle]